MLLHTIPVPTYHNYTALVLRTLYWLIAHSCHCMFDIPTVVYTA